MTPPVSAIPQPRTEAGRRVQRQLEYLSLEPEESIAKKIAAIEAEAAAGTFDLAWAEAEAALPEGWDLMVGHTSECKYCDGWWATASKRLTDPPHYPRIISSETGRPRGEHHDPTPAAALHALAAKLAEAKP